MSEKADIITNILNTVLASDDIDQAILKLSAIIEYVNSQEAPQQTEPFQLAYSQVLLLH